LADDEGMNTAERILAVCCVLISLWLIAASVHEAMLSMAV
jgi:hypothetical protein